MPPSFTLDLATDPVARRAALRLADGDGRHLAAHEVDLGLERWQPCLDLLGEIEQMQRALGVGEHEIAGTRFNRYGPLTRLGELGDARAVLEGCLEIYRRVGT
jgi:hypothetical protein